MEELRQIITLAQLPEVDGRYLLELYEKLQAEPAHFEAFCGLKAAYLAGDECVEPRKRLARSTGIHPFTLDLLLLLCCFCALRKTYAQKGLSEELFVESLADVRYKLEECRMVYGICGNFVFHWYRGFFDCTRFKLGRLQFEPHEMKNDYRDVLKTGDMIYRCHIPMAGSLTPEMVQDSIKQAYEFYKPEGALYIHCSSWLLFPEHYALYPEGSNLRKFYDLFDIYASKLSPDSSNSWRVFGTMEKRPDCLPGDNSLRRAFREYLRAGKVMGSGSGVITYWP